MVIIISIQVGTIRVKLDQPLKYLEMIYKRDKVDNSISIIIIMIVLQRRRDLFKKITMIFHLMNTLKEEIMINSAHFKVLLLLFKKMDQMTQKI